MYFFWLQHLDKLQKKAKYWMKQYNFYYILQLISLHLCTWQMLLSKNDSHYIECKHFVMHPYGNQSHDDRVIPSTMIYRIAFVTKTYRKNVLK